MMQRMRTLVLSSLQSAARGSGYSRLRRGISILEVCVAGILVATLMTISARMLNVVATQRTASDQRQVAIQEASSALDRLTVLPWDDLTSEKLAAGGADDAVPTLPKGKLKVTVEDAAEDLPARRVTVEVDWRSGTRAHAPVRLSAWVFRRGGSP